MDGKHSHLVEIINLMILKKDKKLLNQEEELSNKKVYFYF